MVSLADLYKAEGKEEDELIKKFIEENSYPMPKRKMEKMYIGYIDINGMQYMMKTMETCIFETMCNEIAGVVDSILEENAEYPSVLGDDATIEFHMFSDNMIFLCKNLSVLVTRMGLLQRKLIIQLGLSVKGCIDYGDIYYYKNRFILGKGLVSAYKIDADYHNPAIRISRNIIENEVHDKPSRFIKKVAYDEYVVDFYCIAQAFSEDFEIEEIGYIKDFIRTNLAKNYSDDVMHKYIWMKEFHNEYCKKNALEEMII